MLVIGAETLSKYVNWEDRNTCILFGDGAGAAVFGEVEAGYGMFGLGQESGTPIVPIVSSVKLAKISQRLGATAIVVEGKEAGGHLGTSTSVRELIPGIRAAVDIPVVAAGGVLSGQDIVDLIKMGANGVQMGSRFAASVESNAAPALKEFYLKAKPEDIVVIHSPVGLPGRAVRNPFAERIMVTHCFNTCFLLELDNGEYFLTDAGGGNGILRQLELAGADWQRLHHMFVTHGHTDHILGVIWVIRKIATLMNQGKFTGEFHIYCHGNCR